MLDTLLLLSHQKSLTYLLLVMTNLKFYFVVTKDMWDKSSQGLLWKCPLTIMKLRTSALTLEFFEYLLLYVAHMT